MFVFTYIFEIKPWKIKFQVYYRTNFRNKILMQSKLNPTKPRFV